MYLCMHHLHTQQPLLVITAASNQAYRLLRTGSKSVYEPHISASDMSELVDVMLLVNVTMHVACYATCTCVRFLMSTLSLNG